QFWNDRQGELQKFRQDLSTLERTPLGATNRIQTAFPDVALANLEDWYGKLSGTDAEIASATASVKDTLNWSVEPFKTVMDLRARLAAGQTPEPPRPTDAEWAEMERLLTTAYKQYQLWE